MNVEIDYYVLDLESSGLDLKRHEVTQISIIRCSDRFQLNKFIKAEHPETASWEALKITGRTLKDIVTGENKEDVIEFVEGFLNQDGKDAESRCMVGHNVHRFDTRFTHALWEKVGKAFPAHLWLDTLPFTKAYALKYGIAAQKFNLDASLEIAGIVKKGEAHNAKIDTRNTYRLWKKLMESGTDYLSSMKRAPHLL